MCVCVCHAQVAIVEDFPWREFNIKLVQIEQLDERGYPAQRGKKARVIRRMTSVGYRMVKNYTVAEGDTEDLIFVRKDELREEEGHLAALISALNTTTHRAIVHGRERGGVWAARDRMR